ncbi:MBL fold metallo-hydrolase [Amphibacillus sp. Q70]|uniref:MBL fold metallo-hydrolase n=1 Tax=Amphibacillus sp. Q70 TaxID=3453416 RepID=UPI003F865ABB
MKKLIIVLGVWLVFLTGCGTELDNQQNSTNQATQEDKETTVLAEDEEIGDEREKEQAQDDQPKQAEINSELVIHFIDVGQADATLFQTDDVTILFDAGNWNRRDVVEYLQALHIEKIDLLIGSHPDADHIGQMPLILEQFQVDEMWMSGVESTSRVFEQTLNKMLEHEVNYHEPRAGESYQLGDLLIEVIAPEQLTNDANEDSISIFLQYGNSSVVMTGDAGARAEANMIDVRESLAADILHVGHHGSNTSTSASFLTAVNPDYAIISAGEDNSYGHPDQEVVDRIRDNGTELFMTYQHGTIIFASDGQTFEVESMNDQPFDPDKSDTSNESILEKEKSSDLIQSDDQKSGCIDINSASVDELMGIIHIGEVRANDIVDLRPFESVEALIKVDGIGEARLADIISEQKACVR